MHMRRFLDGCRHTWRGLGMHPGCYPAFFFFVLCVLAGIDGDRVWVGVATGCVIFSVVLFTAASLSRENP
jgi:hypothetical protein